MTQIVFPDHPYYAPVLRFRDDTTGKIGFYIGEHTPSENDEAVAIKFIDEHSDLVAIRGYENGISYDASEPIAIEWLAKFGTEYLCNHGDDANFPRLIEDYAGPAAEELRADFFAGVQEIVDLNWSRRYA